MSWLDAQGGSAWRQARDEGRAAVVRLPYPPTANNLFAPMLKRSKRTGRTVMTKRKTEEAKTYTEEVWYHVRIQRGHRQFAGPVVMMICATPPDSRRRDAMNLEKAVTDSIVAAGVMLDDSQVRDCRIVWAHTAYDEASSKAGVEVSVRELLPHELGIAPPVKAPRRTAEKAAVQLLG